MVATRFISMHTGKGKTPAVSLTERIDYILNLVKTDDGQWVSSYKCDPVTVATEMLLAQRMTKGRYQFVVATHVDKNHIHNHVIFSAVSEDAALAQRPADFAAFVRLMEAAGCPSKRRAGKVYPVA